MSVDELRRRRLENARRACLALRGAERFEMLIELAHAIDRDAVGTPDRHDLDDVVDTLGYARRRRAIASQSVRDEERGA